MTKNWKKITAEKKIKFVFDQKLQFTYPEAVIKNVKVTEDAFSSQRGQHFKTCTLNKNSTFVGHLCPRGSGSTDPIESGSGSENLLFFFLSKTAIYLSRGIHKERPRYRRSLQLSKEAIQHFKTWT
jgi:hypothetical protein